MKSPTGPRPVVAEGRWSTGAPLQVLRTRPVLTWIGITLASIFVCSLLVARYVPSQSQLSPFDEWVYSDYLDGIGRMDLPQRGELVEDYAMMLNSCRGTLIYGLQGSPCGGPYDPTQYPQHGITSADIHSPVYFTMTWVAARVLQASGAVSDLLTAGRLVGALWLGLGVALMLALCRELGAHWSASLGLCLLVVASPGVRWTNTYVTPDAMNLAVGAALVLSALRVSDGRTPRWLLVLLCGLATAIKAQNVLAVGLVALVLLWRSSWVEGAGAAPGSLWARGSVARGAMWMRATAALCLLAAGLVQVIWLIARSLISVGQAPGQGLVASPPTLLDLLKAATVFMLGIGQGPTLPPPHGGYHLPGELLSWLLVAGVVGTVFTAGPRTIRNSVSGALFVAVVLGGPALVLLSYLLSGVHFPLPTRYALSLLPAAAALAAALASHRSHGLVLMALGAGAYLGVLIVPGSW